MLGVCVCYYLSPGRVYGHPQFEVIVAADLQSRVESGTPGGYYHVASALDREGRERGEWVVISPMRNSEISHVNM